MNNIRLVGLLLLILAIPICLIAQFQSPEILPPSPEARAFEKYGNLPVSTYSGTPDISIPLYEVSNGDIHIPITLRYHASGIKVDEEASWVGLGWVLNAGGVISRTIVGKDDLHNPWYFGNSVQDLEKDFFAPYNTYVDPSVFNFDCQFEYLDNLTISDELLSPNSAYDFQPDQYSFNFGGYSGTFTIKRDNSGDPQTIFTSINDKLLLRPVFDYQNPNNPGYPTANNNTIDYWEVTDPSGMIYTFAEMEFDLNGSSPSPTSWYLTKISSPTGKVVELHYDRKVGNIANTGSVKSTGITPICIQISGSGSASGCPTNYLAETVPQAPRLYEVPVLAEIDFGFGMVKLHSTNTDRIDLLNGNRLNELEVYMKEENGDLTSLPTKKFAFEYGYLTSEGIRSQWDVDGADNYYTYTDGQLASRMKLEKVIELSNDGSIPLSQCPTYSFSYIEPDAAPPFKIYHDLPAKTSLARDHWGYFNGKTGNTELHPKLVGILADFFSIFKEFDGADKRSNGAYAQAFSLNKITYPSGGTTSLVYESNTYDYDASSEHDDYADYLPDLERERITGTATRTATNHVPITKTFTVTENFFPVALNGTARIKLEATFICNTTPCPAGVGSSLVSVKIFKDDGSNTMVPNAVLGLDNTSCNSSVPCNIQNGSFQIGLAPGDYKVVALADDPGISFASFELEYDYIPNIIQGGGLRISEMITYDGIDHDNDIYRKYEYHYWEDKDNDGNEEEYSYGRRLARPVYGRFKDGSVWKDGASNGQTTQCLGSTELSYSISANSLTPLQGYGGIIGYDKVVEKLGTDGSVDGIYGKTEYTYHNEPDVINTYLFRRPPGIPNFPHHESSLNGMLKKQAIFRYDGSGTFSCIQSVENEYDDPGANKALIGIYMEAFDFQNTSSCNIALAPCKVLSYMYPVVTKTWPRLMSTTETVYDLSANLSSSKTTNYSYDLSLRKLRSTSSPHADGSIHSSTYTYAGEGGSGVPVQMYDPNDQNYQHMPDILISEETLYNGSAIHKSIMNYQYEGGTDRVLLMNQQIHPDGGIEMIKQYLSYDPQSNITQVVRDAGQPNSYVWGYNHTFPTATVPNSSPDNIAYTSFEYGVEENSNNQRLDGNWQMVGAGGWDEADARTGTGRYNVSDGNEIKTTVTDAGSYTLSFWTTIDNDLTNDFDITPAHTVIHDGSRIINGWKYYELDMTLTAGQEVKLMGNQSPITYYNWVDELRLYPSNAQMSTICYDKQLRIHTMTDANNQSVYYTYDALGRLIEVRDFEGNLINQTEYKLFPN